jgi:hypothetical protein
MFVDIVTCTIAAPEPDEYPELAELDFQLQAHNGDPSLPFPSASGGTVQLLFQPLAKDGEPPSSCLASLAKEISQAMVP